MIFAVQLFVDQMQAQHVTFFFIYLYLMAGFCCCSKCHFWTYRTKLKFMPKWLIQCWNLVDPAKSFQLIFLNAKLRWLRFVPNFSQYYHFNLAMNISSLRKKYVLQSNIGLLMCFLMCFWPKPISKNSINFQFIPSVATNSSRTSWMYANRQPSVQRLLLRLVRNLLSVCNLPSPAVHPYHFQNIRASSECDGALLLTLTESKPHTWATLHDNWSSAAQKLENTRIYKTKSTEGKMLWELAGASGRAGRAVHSSLATEEHPKQIPRTSSALTIISAHQTIQQFSGRINFYL